MLAGADPYPSNFNITKVVPLPEGLVAAMSASGLRPPDLFLSWPFPRRAATSPS